MRPPLPRILPVALVAALALAGCSGDEAGERTDGPAPGLAPASGLEGWVFDPAVRPLADVLVKVLDTNASVRTDADGRYSFTGLPTERFIVLVATKETFKPSSQQLTLPAEGLVRLNFTLVPEPVKVPSKVVDKLEGFLSCAGSVEVAETALPVDCASGQQDHIDTWEFSSAPELAGAVIEVFWEPVSPAAESLHARLETLGLGDRNLVLGEITQTSPIRLSIPAETAAKYFAEGGQYRLTVSSRPDTDATEAGAGASMAVQQPYEAFYSFFYVEGPSPTYTVADAS